LHAISAGSELLDSTPRRVGLPAWDIVWARRGEAYVGFELAGDDPWRKSKSGSNSRKGENTLEEHPS